MSRGTLGSFNGTATTNANMVDVFRGNEVELHRNSVLAFVERMIIREVGIQYDPGTEVSINGCGIPTVSGVSELGYGQVDIASLVLKQAVAINIYYMH